MDIVTVSPFDLDAKQQMPAIVLALSISTNFRGAEAFSIEPLTRSQLPATLGLRNGKTVLPDFDNSNRERMERADPFTADDRPFATAVKIKEDARAECQTIAEIRLRKAIALSPDRIKLTSLRRFYRNLSNERLIPIA